MNADQLRLSIALAHAVPGAALRISARDGGAFYATAHPAGELRIDELRTTMIAGDARDAVGLRLDDLVTEAEVGGSLFGLGAGLYLSENDQGPTLWSAVPLSPTEIEAALTTVECPPAPASIEVILRPDAELGATIIGVSSVLEVADDDLIDVAIHVLGACLAFELEPRLRHRSTS